MLNAALFVICGITALLAQSQTIYKCPDTNGRVALQDLPCAGGEQRQIKPASGSDQKATVAIGTPSISVPKNDLDRLRDSVGKDAAARKFKEADYDVGVFNQRSTAFRPTGHKRSRSMPSFTTAAPTNIRSCPKTLITAAQSTPS